VKQVEKPDAKLRDGNCMARWSCQSRMKICCSDSGNSNILVVRLFHKLPHYDIQGKHTPYENVAMPGGAEAIIRENLEWSTPSNLVPQVQALFKHVTSKQIHHAWRRMSEEVWKRQENQMNSARQLLQDFQAQGAETKLLEFGPSEVPEGVEILAFSFPKVISSLQQGRNVIEEIGLDATCKYFPTISTLSRI
jgi:hypothetical protein